MSEDEFYIFSIVEGEGEIDALPKLLHRICRSPDYPFILRTIDPHRVARDKFLNNSEYRKLVFLRAAKTVHKYVREHRKIGVLILIDAEDSCCLDFLNSDKMQEIREDIDSILVGVSPLFVLAEKGYESWLVAGLGGPSEGSPSRWLTNNPGKSGLLEAYSKIPDQSILTSSDRFDIDLATTGNVSFRRLRERVLAMARTVPDAHS